jgi:glyoxylase I family protein
MPVIPSTTAFDHYGISVTDLRRSLDFYCGVLGAVVILAPTRVEEFGFHRAVVVLNDSMGIDLNEHAMNSGERFEPSRTGLDHLAFSVASYDALEAWAAYLDAKSVARSPIRKLAGVGEAFDFCDPDGIQLELWHRDHGGAWAAQVNQILEESRQDSAGI